MSWTLFLQLGSAKGTIYLRRNRFTLEKAWNPLRMLLWEWNSGERNEFAMCCIHAMSWNLTLQDQSCLCSCESLDIGVGSSVHCWEKWNYETLTRVLWRLMCSNFSSSMFWQRTPKVDFSEIKEYETSFDWYDKRLWDLVKSGDEYAQEFFRLLALCHTVMAEEKDGTDFPAPLCVRIGVIMFLQSPDLLANTKLRSLRALTHVLSCGSHSTRSHQQTIFFTNCHLSVIPLLSGTTVWTLTSTFGFPPKLLFSCQKQRVKAHKLFSIVVGVLEYQAQSPDENALVSAARNFGFVFKSRTPKTVTIEVFGKQEVHELLCILDFNNVRKRMSVSNVNNLIVCAAFPSRRWTILSVLSQTRCKFSVFKSWRMLIDINQLKTKSCTNSVGFTGDM